jgi:hypothetical protein
MANKGALAWLLVLSLLLTGDSSEASLAQQGSPQGRYGEALKHWETTLDTAEGDERAALGLAGVVCKSGCPKRDGEPVVGE